jgi:hypothetical protein
MPYDKNLDKNVFSEVFDLGTSRVTVGVFSYNNGEKKLQLSRENKNASDEWVFSKLGRLTKDEVQAILPAMQKALESMSS